MRFIGRSTDLSWAESWKRYRHQNHPYSEGRWRWSFATIGSSDRFQFPGHGSVQSDWRDWVVPLLMKRNWLISADSSGLISLYLKCVNQTFVEPHVCRKLAYLKEDTGCVRARSISYRLRHAKVYGHILDRHASTPLQGGDYIYIIPIFWSNPDPRAIWLSPRLYEENIYGSDIGFTQIWVLDKSNTEP